MKRRSFLKGILASAAAIPIVNAENIVRIIAPNIENPRPVAWDIGSFELSSIVYVDVSAPDGGEGTLTNPYASMEEAYCGVSRAGDENEKISI